MNIYQHFRADEQNFIDQVIDWALQVEGQYAPYLTTFLNPRQLFILKAVIGQYKELNFQAFGGYKNAEQKRVLIYPSYFEPELSDFEITLFEIIYPKKFATLAHGQIMGSVLGAGISRSNLGDILTDGERWQFFIDQKMEDFVRMNVEQIGRTNIELEKISIENKIDEVDKWKKKEIIVSSLRIDVVLARALHLSRKQAKKLINDKKIKINWTENIQPDIEVEAYDIISIRGYGRVQIYQQKGITRKENMVLEIGIIDRNS